MQNKFHQNLGILIITMMVGILGLQEISLAQTSTPETTATPAAKTETPVANNLDNTGIRAFPLKYLSIQNETPGIQGTQGREYLTTATKNPAATFVIQVINFITLSIASLSFLAIVIAGFMILVSAGDPNSVNQGKTVITHAAIGLAITLSAYYIVAFVQSILFETIS